VHCTRETPDSAQRRRSVRIADLLDPAPEPADTGPAQTPLRLMGIVAALVVGAALLAATLRVKEGSLWFDLLGLLVAATWLIGARVSGPIRIRPTRPSPHVTALWALAIAGLSFLGFLGADLIGQHISFVSSALHSVLARADTGPRAIVLVVALVNGVAEEAFFRGALYSELSAHRPVLTSTIIYVVVTAATGNVALIVAAAVMGVIFALERRATGSILASTITHLGWSTLMIFCLPR
jgi:membrane protease YdiL (CAAX protease family)